MLRLSLAPWLALAFAAQGCAREATFDPAPFIGSWRGRWTDDAGQRGLLTVEVSARGDELTFTCEVGGVARFARGAGRERVVARVQGGSARFAEHESASFGRVRGVLDADGGMVVECEDVRGPIDSLYAHGSWVQDELVLEVDVSYDGSLRAGLAVVELARRSGR